MAAFSQEGGPKVLGPGAEYIPAMPCVPDSPGDNDPHREHVAPSCLSVQCLRSPAGWKSRA
eukprot:3462447-Lingulodinium_polyedra.AAC.1